MLRCQNSKVKGVAVFVLRRFYVSRKMSLFSNSNGRIGRTNADQYNERNLERFALPQKQSFWSSTFFRYETDFGGCTRAWRHWVVWVP